LFPLEQPYGIATNSEVWQHEDDMITDLFKPPRDDVLQHSHDDIQSYPGGFDEGKDLICPEKDFCNVLTTYFE
jgi:hypothetical protein